jgi:hypothetical protein
MMRTGWSKMQGNETNGKGKETKRGKRAANESTGNVFQLGKEGRGRL